MMVYRRRAVVIWVAIQLAGFSAAAHAYLDPGTGSILVQSFLAGLAGAVAVVSLYWRRVKQFFANLRKPSSRDAPGSASSTHSSDGS
jgi:Na+/proline symporter